MAASKNCNVTTQVQIYKEKHLETFQSAAKSVREVLENKLKQVPIRFSTSFRAKGSESLEKKLKKEKLGDLPIESWLPNNGKSSDKNSKSIKDLGGVRISLYFPSDWPFVEDIILESFNNVTMKLHPDDPESRSERQQFDGYVARHYCVDTALGFRIEIQVGSAMIHAWMEAEHDILYKEQEGAESPESYEFATIDGLNGLALAGDTILNGLKVQLLKQGIIKYKEKHDRLSSQKSALKGSKNEFTLIGQNLYRTLVGEDDAQKAKAKKFKKSLINRLKDQDNLNVYIAVANPENDTQMKRFEYGFPKFRKHLYESKQALNILQASAKKQGVGDRLRVGTHVKISLDSLTLSDPRSNNGVAFLTYSSLGSHPEHRAIRKIEKKKHKDHFSDIVKNHRWRFGLQKFDGERVNDKRGLRKTRSEKASST